ncbi:putative DNA helicase INO80 [Gracilariopsis chorda]|uniref:Chromatin-remodeling ATPase INO80 n=1 Tax=Gracilariopsis chorda TaxID=448386 RepID=A0A2V3IVZ3_9FLOR|nr:putative DNA helicase INO80 [Gracilariopsis chorda]|eukprot:PXF46259.1 putative DNA helicase INO80 [Gracilariopsis chorda]
MHRSHRAESHARHRSRMHEDDEQLTEDGPPAGVVFDPVITPKADGARSVVPFGALDHAGALRRACVDKRIARRAMHASWLAEDDPMDNTKLIVCGTPLIIPVSFDDHCVLTAFERELDRVEAKFRAGRKDKSIGGELGSIVIKKKVVKGRKSFGRGASSDIPNGSMKRTAAAPPHGEKNPKRVKEVEKPKKPVDYTSAYRNAIKPSEIARMVKNRSNTITSQMRFAKGYATACAKESRKAAFRSVRVIDEAHRRARRIVRDVLSYWKKEDKERQEERKRLMARAQEHRKQEADEREAQRQKNKLKFLLGQSEAFSNFLKAKTKATAEADGRERAAEAKKKKQATGKDIDSITGAEDEDELRKIAEDKARELVARHRAQIEQFDTETKKKKSVAMEASEKAAANRAATMEALDMNGVTDAEREIIEQMEAEKKGGAASPSAPSPGSTAKPSSETRLAGSEKPEVAAVRQPTILNCKMKDYQLRGLAWLVSLYDQGINGILADEMGLGKTLQTIAFLAYLCEKEDNWGPFLVVSPKATLHNWQQEVTKFCPALKVLPYWGNKNDRNELRKYWSHKRMYRRDSEFQVCITSYETLTMDEKYFNRVKWQYLVLDEAQAIKNSNSSRWRALLQFPCRNRLLLTGTPLQNKLSELWSLLHFIMPTIFDSHAEFADWFAKDIEGHAQDNRMLDAATLSRLRTLLDPFMLRRVKRDVESEMPPKTEVHLPCLLSARQRQLYATIRANITPEELERAIVPSGPGNGNSERQSKLMNLVMQLRKVCNHPETFERRVPQAPYQFQVAPPPTHVAPPPSVLMASNVAAAPLDITLVCRSELEVVAPRCVHVLEEDMAYMQHLIRQRYGAWVRQRVSEEMMRGGKGMSVIRLCGGVSASEASDYVLDGALPWNWQRYGHEVDEELLRLQDVYFIGKGKDVEEGDGSCREVLTRPHRILMEVRGESLRRRKQVVLRSEFDEPAQLIAREARMLKSTRVYIPKVASPLTGVYLPGDGRQSLELHSEASLPYPGFPHCGETYRSGEVYEFYRVLDGGYGAHVGNAPIQMPEASRLVADCGKMTVLDPLLRRLKAEGHKCLVYSQFTRVLDILEDYCGKSGYKFVRLDGQSALADRRDIVAEWQTNEELFIFLLSTRAGGVGLNLTAADTVIFFDSDWNPTQDLQAMDRAHRLGQERPVTVYRLITQGTIEERVLLRAQQKNRINELVIKGGGLQTDVEENRETELDDIAALLMGEDEGRGAAEGAEMAVIAQRAAALVRARQ